MERKINSDNHIICEICGKMYSSKKWLTKHEVSHLDKPLTKVNIARKPLTCKLCSYESDRKSSMDK